MIGCHDWLIMSYDPMPNRLKSWCKSQESWCKSQKSWCKKKYFPKAARPGVRAIPLFGEARNDDATAATATLFGFEGCI